MNGCVDKDSPIFKKLCEDYGVAPSHMELIVHSWWKTHNDGSFPDNAFINNYKYGESVEMSDNDILLAEERNYFGSKEFDNRDEAVSYYKRLASLYPKKAIGSFTNTNGKTVITLSKPVISSNLKYKNYNKPVVGAAIDVGGSIETITKVERRTSTEWIITTENGFRSVIATEDGGFNNRNGSKVEITGAVPYYNEYQQASTNPTLEDNSDSSTPQGTTLSTEVSSNERERILSEAKRDSEGNLLAPNGRVSNLSEDNYVLVRTQAFKDWFGDWENDPSSASKVVDENGEPLLVYHGTNAQFDKFSIDKAGENTGITTYTDKTTGEEFTSDSVGSIFFSDSYGVAAQYGILGNYNLHGYRLSLVRSAISTLYDGRFSKQDFKSFDEFVNFLESLSEYNPRFTNIAKYLRKNKEEGKKTTQAERDAIRGLLIDVAKQMKALQSWTFQNAADYLDILKIAGKVIKEYNNPEGIQRLLNGEIPKEVQRLVYANTHPDIKTDSHMLTMSYSTGINDSYYFNLNDNGELELQTPSKTYKVKELSREELGDILSKFGEAVKSGIATYNADISYAKLREGATVFSSFLNIRDPFDHDYEGTRMGQGYKGSKTTSFGYVAARQRKRATEQGKDGMIYRNIQDPYLADNYAVFDANQIMTVNKEEPHIDKSDTETLDKLEKETQKALDKAKEDKAETLEALGGTNDPNARTEFDATIVTATAGIALEEALKGVNPVFTKEEQDQIKEALKVTPDGRLRVMSVSRQTDLAFFSKEIVKFLEENAKKPLTDPTRVNVIEVWTKHDGEPIQDILEACQKYKVAPMVSFSITGMGGTAMEQGVMKYQDLLDRIEKLVKAGALNPATTTIRIDPILVGETKLEDIKTIVEKAKAIGIKKFVTSLVQSYGYLDGTARDRKVTSGINDVLAKEGRAYDWDKYYGRDANGKINFKPKKEYIEEIGNFLVELNKDPDIEIETCAFPVKGLKNSACLDPMIIERVTGVDVTSPDGKYKKDTSRKDCMCYGAHSDMFRPNQKKCFSSCAYCYAAHSGDNNLNYYNENGTIKDNPYTRVRLNQQQTEQEQMEKVSKKEKENQKFIDSNVKLSGSLVNLQTSKVLTAVEVEEIATSMVNWVSDQITAIQNRDSEVLKRYEPFLRELNLDTAERIDIARAIGLNKLLEDCRNNFMNAQKSGVSFREAMQLQVINKNWNALIYLASTTFMENEKFSITSDGEIKESTNENADNFNESKDPDEVKELQGSTQENWQIEARTRDIIQNATAKVRDALRQCYLLDENGDKQTTKFGINSRVEVHDAVSSILRWTQGAQDIDEMVDMLEAKVKSNPWIKQIIDRLNDRSGKESDFQSQFFVTFCQREQLYAVVKADRDADGNIKFKSVPVNRSPALKEAFTSVANQFKIGEHPLFTSKGVNETALKGLTEIRDLLQKNKDTISKEELDKALLFAFHSLGYYTTLADIAEVTKDKSSVNKMIESLDYIVNSLTEHKDDSNYQPFVFDKNKDSGSIYGNLRNMLRPLTERLEDTAISSFYEDGKMYQTYTLPSYMTNLMAKLHQKDEAKFEEFIMKQYGSSEWFKEQNGDSGSGWRLPWLDRMMSDKAARNIFDHKVQLSFNKQAYLTEMGDLQYTLSILTEFFNEKIPNGATEVPAWFRVPMLSNKSSSEYIKFYKYVGTRYKDSIALGMTDIMYQEIARMRTVRIRNLEKGDKGFIKNWDTRGKSFNLLTFLNSYLDESDTSEFSTLLKKAVSKEGLSDAEQVTLTKKAKEVIMREMQKKANDILEQYQRDGIVEAAANIENIGKSESEILDNLENFIWNDAFAAMNILELTITDPAYYDGAVDLQKRFAQIHAPGSRPNVKATDYEGNRVADAYSRTIVLTDFEGLQSNIIDNLTEVFDRKIENSAGAERELYRAMKKDIIKQFKDINLTDAQAYNSPTSYRKKAILFGRWSKEKEEVYQKLMKKESPSVSDLQKAFGEVLKPFVYTQTIESVGKEGSPIQDIPVPFQNKNSEYLLIMADAILRGENTSKPNLLRAIYDVMEDSAKNNPTKGIDTVQFASAIKSGLHDPINLKQFAEDPFKGETLAKEHILNSIYESNIETGERTLNYKPSVRLIEWMDYGIQQEVPQHFTEHEQAHGSQIRAITVSELTPGIKLMLEGEEVSPEKFAQEYENTIAENIKESIKELEKEFNIQGTRKERNIALAKVLKEELESSSRYGIDLKQACLLDANGEFNIPLGDPIQSKRIEQLINSVIKNRINKQKIAGGPVVQVSNFGTSQSLNIKFKDKNNSGKTLMSKAEWELNAANGLAKESSFEEYIKNNQGGIEYLEVYAPAYYSEVFERFTKEDGTIDIKAIEELDPELLKMVGYRIPTEDKYSCAPIKIVGFLPKWAGDGIMLPAEITLLSGSDFDVDKIYLMVKEYSVQEDRDSIYNELYNELIKSQDKTPNHETKRALHDLVNQFLDRPYDKEYLINQKTAEGYLSMTEAAYNKLLKSYRKARRNPKKLKVKWPNKGKGYRNNKIVDMTYEVLTHEDSADKILNPGGFEPQKRLGYIVAAMRATGRSYDELNSLSLNALKDLSSTNMNLAFIDTHVQFYKQNSAAAALIGMFAVHKVAHAFIERDPLYIDFKETSGLKVPMLIGNTILSNMVKIDPTKDSNQALIGKSLGSLVASAADAAKDPVLNLMNINKDTANILNTAIRLGVPFEDAALLLSQSCMTEILNELSQRRLRNEPASLAAVINDRLDDLKEETGMKDENSLEDLLRQGLSKEQLTDGVITNSEDSEIKVLSFIKALSSINKELKGVTLATRFNSISNAAGPLIVDNIIMEQKMKEFSKYIKIYNEATGTFLDIDGIKDVLALHPILEEFSKGYIESRKIMRDMPLYSYDFGNIVNALTKLKAESIITNRENLSKFADFYNSYLLVSNGVINPGDCSYYINDFPKEFFFVNNYKEKYRGNPLVDAMKLDIDSKTGLASIKVDITGLNTKQKGNLISGFIDLLSKDKELAIKLFNYNFFKGGVGFTPKTFMSLTPLLLKQAIEGYNDSFLSISNHEPREVIELFIRNNWTNSDFVKYMPYTSRVVEKNGDIKEEPNFYKNPDGSLTLKNKALYSNYESQGYVRIKIDGEDKLFKQIYSNDDSKTLLYVEIKPLGGKNSYLEFTSTPMKISDNVSGIDSGNGIRKEAEGTESSYKETVTPDMSLIQRAFESAGLSSERASAKIQELQKKPKQELESIKPAVINVLREQFTKLNIRFTEQSLEEEFKKLNLCK